MCSIWVDLVWTSTRHKWHLLLALTLPRPIRLSWIKRYFLITSQRSLCVTTLWILISHPLRIVSAVVLILLALSQAPNNVMLTVALVLAIGMVWLLLAPWKSSWLLFRKCLFVLKWDFVVLLHTIGLLEWFSDSERYLGLRFVLKEFLFYVIVFFENLYFGL